jgi:hypothetical protein
MAKMSEGNVIVLQDGARELTSEEIDLVSGGIARPKPDGGRWDESVPAGG